jgi:RNA polymerase sigma-70 factor (ECF subfamily)
LNDQELVAGIAQRDPEAFRTLMERYAAPVINLAFRFLGTVADAEDVAQDVFLRLYQQPPALDPSTKLFTWLYRVTVNRCLDLLRKRPRRSEVVSLDAPVSGDESPEATLAERYPDPSGKTPRDLLTQAERATVTRKAVAALPDALRASLILSTFEELSHGQIGQLLGISPKAVERRIARARQLLRARLAPYL